MGGAWGQILKFLKNFDFLIFLEVLEGFGRFGEVWEGFRRFWEVLGVGEGLGKIFEKIDFSYFLNFFEVLEGCC